MKSAHAGIVTDVVAAIRAEKPASRWNHPWLKNIGTAIVGGLVVYGITAARSHSADDQKRDITLEVSKQLEPINSRLEKMDVDIARIKQRDGIIGKDEPSAPGPSRASPLLQFVALDQPRFARALPRVAAVASEAQGKGETDTIQNTDAVQKKLAMIPLTTPDALRAASSIINYASFVREKGGLIPNVGAVRAKPCPTLIHIEGPKDRIRAHISNSDISICTLELDGLSLRDVTIRNAIVTYDGGAVQLENARFINCLFVVSLPAQPSGPARQFANEILVKNVGQKPTFTATVG
jgi:hypothetical protein